MSLLMVSHLEGMPVATLKLQAYLRLLCFGLFISQDIGAAMAGPLQRACQPSSHDIDCYMTYKVFAISKWPILILLYVYPATFGRL